MARVECIIDETTIENENGYETPAVIATCKSCGRTTESFGTSESSIKRCLVLMKEECGKGNFYIEETLHSIK